MSGSYLQFATLPVLRVDNPIVEGQAIDGFIEALGISELAPGVLTPTEAGTSVLTYRFTGHRRPVSLRPRAWTVKVALRTEADFLLWQRVTASGRPFRMFTGFPVFEIWKISHRESGQTAYDTARRMGWGLSGVSHATHPPKAYIDGTELTVVADEAAPELTELGVPTTQTAGQAFFTVTANAAIAGRELQLLHWPEYLVRWEEEASYFVEGERVGRLEFSGTLREVLSST